MEIPTEKSNFHPSTLLVPVLALPGILFCLPPLVLQVRARNTAASILVGNLMLVNLYNFVNAIIWPDDCFMKRYNGAGLCDLEVKIFVGVAASGAGSTLCIFRQLFTIIDPARSVERDSKVQRRFTNMIEAAACIGIPICSMATHYIVQPSRYLLLPVMGCGASLDSSWVGLVLIAGWPLLLYGVAAVYAALAVVQLLRHRREVSAILVASSTSKSYYFRLFAFAFVFLMINLPLGVFTFARNSWYHLRPYSWNSVHPKEWSQVILEVKWNEWQPGYGTDRYVQIVSGYIIFAFWGLGSEAKILYRSVLERMGKTQFWCQLSCSTAWPSPLTTRSEISISSVLMKLGLGQGTISVSTTELPTDSNGNILP